MANYTTNFTTLSEFADFITQQGDGATVTLDIGLVASPIVHEQMLLEAVAMARTSGAIVLFSRTISGESLLWHRFHCEGSRSVIAWLLWELESISSGERAESISDYSS